MLPIFQKKFVQELRDFSVASGEGSRLPQSIPKFSNLVKGHMMVSMQLVNGSEKHLGDRPTKRTPERENLLLLAIARGLPLKAGCKLAGLGFTTFNGWREEDPLFAQKIEFAEAQAIERNLALIQRAALKDWKAAAWILERRHPDMFARPEVQLSQPVQAPLNDVISWLYKTSPTALDFVRNAPTDEEALGLNAQP